MTDIFDLYRDPKKHDELKAILNLGTQKHPAGLAQNFLEKDIWVAEVLRLLYNENLLGTHSTAFKGGTALSKCWRAIERFSEDIDLSIHWSDLAGEADEIAAWEQSTENNSQKKKFRKRQTKLLTEWSTDLIDRLNERLAQYEIDGLRAELEPGSEGEKVNVHFPRLSSYDSNYQLDYILLEFGGRNRGRPTVSHEVGCYLAELEELQAIAFPQATVAAYHPGYVLWEKLTALHQFSTQERDPDPHRLARHWYDVDCLLQQEDFANPLDETVAMKDVVAMKGQRWAQRGVSFEEVLDGRLILVPEGERLNQIAADHSDAIEGRMFFGVPDDFETIVSRLRESQDWINTGIGQVTHGK
ncbi:nucleotidyl transferase AbiEii/AbiGii toxin family protein [Marinobacter sp. AC-23]|uniref:nucleotidyl transferase AbiEii/AbiGii toxin family protein n=1 Tax=Marinobacter sp. AC-23 TaxID=1879031 RepID=UPI0008DE6549|nr:nucleotidyl transferase AbiEii/AbiGii toxin family protein [Marinobacter sp. AC-23]OHY82025.1 nucleotidyltransferase [Marinobacter sp. AC-23]